MFNLKKNILVGVAVSPENGIEAAQIDYNNRTVLKYASKPLAYDNARKEIADLDLFKETLQDLLLEIEAPAGSDIAITLPSVLFKVVDYPASLGEDEISNAIEEDLVNHPIFQNNDPCVSAVKLQNSTIQFSKIAYTVLQKVMLVEIAMQIKELGYNLINIDTSVNSTLNALIYNDRVNTTPDANWVMLLVDNNFCRVISMSGRNYVDSYEEKISIGEVLGDTENYATVVNAVAPILKNIPSQCLYVISKTNIISAKVLAGQLKYNAPVIHQEDNIFSSEPFIEVSNSIPEDTAKTISLDVIGAAINREIDENMSAYFNLFNANLGDIYILNQPPVVYIFSHKLVMSVETMLGLGILAAILIIAIAVLIYVPINNLNKAKQAKIDEVNHEIEQNQIFLDKNKDISANAFDEGDEIRMGITNNKNIYTYYSIVGTEIPKKLWLTSLDLGKKLIIRGQADNLESIYSFYRNIKDYNAGSNVKLQKLALASNGSKKAISNTDSDDVITSLNADYYEFVISDTDEFEEEEQKDDEKKTDNNEIDKKSKGGINLPGIPNLETID